MATVRLNRRQQKAFTFLQKNVSFFMAYFYAPENWNLPNQKNPTVFLREAKKNQSSYVLFRKALLSQICLDPDKDLSSHDPDRSRAFFDRQALTTNPNFKPVINVAKARRLRESQDDGALIQQYGVKWFITCFGREELIKYCLFHNAQLVNLIHWHADHPHGIRMWARQGNKDVLLRGYKNNVALEDKAEDKPLDQDPEDQKVILQQAQAVDEWREDYEDEGGDPIKRMVFGPEGKSAAKKALWKNIAWTVGVAVISFLAIYLSGGLAAIPLALGWQAIAPTLFLGLGWGSRALHKASQDRWLDSQRVKNEQRIGRIYDEDSKAQLYQARKEDVIRGLIGLGIFLLSVGVGLAVFFLTSGVALIPLIAYAAAMTFMTATALTWLAAGMQWLRWKSRYKNAETEVDQAPAGLEQEARPREASQAEIDEIYRNEVAKVERFNSTSEQKVVKFTREDFGLPPVPPASAPIRELKRSDEINEGLTTLNTRLNSLNDNQTTEAAQISTFYRIVTDPFTQRLLMTPAGKVLADHLKQIATEKWKMPVEWIPHVKSLAYFVRAYLVRPMYLMVQGREVEAREMFNFYLHAGLLRSILDGLGSIHGGLGLIQKRYAASRETLDESTIQQLLTSLPAQGSERVTQSQVHCVADQLSKLVGKTPMQMFYAVGQQLCGVERWKTICDKARFYLPAAPAAGAPAAPVPGVVVPTVAAYVPNPEDKQGWLDDDKASPVEPTHRDARSSFSYKSDRRLSLHAVQDPERAAPGAGAGEAAAADQGIGLGDLGTADGMKPRGA